MQAPKYFLPQGSFFTRSDNRALIVALLIFWYRLRYLECYQPCTFSCYQPQILALYYLLAPFL